MHRLELLISCSATSFQTIVNEVAKTAWVHHEDWNTFVKDIYMFKKGEKQTACFTAEAYPDEDLITLQTNKDGATITACCNMSNMIYKPNIKCEIASNITIEQVKILYEKFNAFAKWW